MEALTDAGFAIPAQLRVMPSNAPKSKHYDQIAFRVQESRLETTGRAGVFDFFQTVFRAEDQGIYIPSMGAAYDATSKGKPRTEASKANYYRTYWRTHQMSDHLPMWVELRVDYSDEYLARKLAGDA